MRAGASGVMCSYNKVNGTYACADAGAIARDLKGTMGFRGFVQSDWGATHSALTLTLTLALALALALTPAPTLIPTPTTTHNPNPNPNPNPHPHPHPHPNPNPNPNQARRTRPPR